MSQFKASHITLAKFLYAVYVRKIPTSPVDSASPISYRIRRVIFLQQLDFDYIFSFSLYNRKIRHNSISSISG